jgi:16S rRNA (cytosine1402-N4)-methyltransferase
MKSVDGILDLGVSLINLMCRERFSTRFDAELDMRMSQKNDLNACSQLYDETNLKSVLDYGELKMPCFGKNNCRSQREQPIKTTE